MPNSVNVLALLEAAMANAKPDPAFVKKYGPPVALTAEQAAPIIFELERAAAADAATEDTTGGLPDAGKSEPVPGPVPGPVLGKDKPGTTEKTRDDKAGQGGKTGNDKTGKDNKTGGKTHP